MRTGEASRTEAQVILTEAQVILTEAKVILTSDECIDNRLIKPNNPEIKRTSQHTYKYLKEAFEKRQRRTLKRQSRRRLRLGLIPTTDSRERNTRQILHHR